MMMSFWFLVIPLVSGSSKRPAPGDEDQYKPLIPSLAHPPEHLYPKNLSIIRYNNPGDTINVGGEFDLYNLPLRSIHPDSPHELPPVRCAARDIVGKVERKRKLSARGKPKLSDEEQAQADYVKEDKQKAWLMCGVPTQAVDKDTVSSTLQSCDSISTIVN